MTKEAKQTKRWRAANPEKYKAACHRHYLRYRERLIPAAKLRRQIRRRRMREEVVRLKSGPCMDCGHSFPPEVMDFDHVRGKKVLNVAALLIKTECRSRILDEIAKCDLVCSNCHRIRTANRRKAANAQRAA